MIIVLSRISIRSSSISIPMAGRMTIRLSSISIPMGKRIVIRYGRIVTNIRLGRIYALEVQIRLRRITIIPNQRILHTPWTYIRFRSIDTLKTYNHTLTAYMDNIMMWIRCGRMFDQSHRLNPLTRMLFTTRSISDRPLPQGGEQSSRTLYTLSLQCIEV